MLILGGRLACALFLGEEVPGVFVSSFVKLEVRARARNTFAAASIAGKPWLMAVASRVISHNPLMGQGRWRMAAPPRLA